MHTLYSNSLVLIGNGQQQVFEVHVIDLSKHIILLFKG